MTMAVTLQNLISHRFRGFSEFENTVAGLTAALDRGAAQVEFDVRVTRCGTPLVYHDEHARGADGRFYHIHEILARDRHVRGAAFAHMPTLDSLLRAVADHPEKDTRLLIDIKDAGFEDMIFALAKSYRLTHRINWVSWVPEALFGILDLDKSAQLCLSHWCLSPDAQTRKIHKVFVAEGGMISRPSRRRVHGERSGWYLPSPLQGPLREAVSSVCVPRGMVSKALVDNYHADGITVSAFSYVDWKTIHAHKAKFGVDDYFIDSKSVFDEIA